MNDRFISDLEQLAIKWSTFDKGDLNQEVENKIRNNIVEICLKSYQSMGKSLEIGRPNPATKDYMHLDKEAALKSSFNDLLKNMEQDWVGEFVQEYRHENEQWKKSLIKISSLDYIRGLFNRVEISA